MAVKFKPFPVVNEPFKIELAFNGIETKKYSEHEWLLTDNPLPGKFDLTIKVDLPSEWEKSVLPPEEHGAKDVRVVGVFNCKEARTGFCDDLKFDGSRYYLKRTINIQDFYYYLSFKFILLRNNQGSNNSYALEKNSALGSSESYYIYFSKKRSVSGGDLEVKWSKFSELHPPASDYSDGVYYLELRDDPFLYFLVTISLYFQSSCIGGSESLRKSWKSLSFSLVP